MHKLSHAAEHFDAFAQVLRTSRGAIAQSLDTPGTKGAVCRSQLGAKLCQLKASATVYCSAAERMRTAVWELTNGCSEHEVSSRVIAYCRFLSDQLSAEERDASGLLAALGL